MSSQHAADWTVYDEMTGPDLSTELWTPADFGTGPRLEPSSRTDVQDGAVTVEVARFANADTENQGLDNTKHLMFSTRGFALPADGPARFAVNLRADLHDTGEDYRQGFASFTLVDLSGGTNRVFAILTNGERVFAEQELLPGHAEDAPYTRIVEDPFFFSRRQVHADTDDHECVIELDRRREQVRYLVDGEILHVAGGVTGLPAEVHMAFGMFTLLPLGTSGGSTHGQGGRASWRRFRSALA